MPTEKEVRAANRARARAIKKAKMDKLKGRVAHAEDRVNQIVGSMARIAEAQLKNPKYNPVELNMGLHNSLSQASKIKSQAAKELEAHRKQLDDKAGITRRDNKVRKIEGSIRVPHAQKVNKFT